MVKVALGGRRRIKASVSLPRFRGQSPEQCRGGKRGLLLCELQGDADDAGQHGHHQSEHAAQYPLDRSQFTAQPGHLSAQAVPQSAHLG